jgi:predicted transcriptional regulator
MTLTEIVEKLGLTAVIGEDKLDSDVAHGYVSDLLSDVLANTDEGDLWITLQIHPNIVGVASIKGLAGIVIIGGRRPEEKTLEKAKQEGIPVLVTEMSSYEVAGKLYALGLPGS